MSRSLLETVVGACVLFIAGFFLYFAYTTVGVSTPSGYKLSAHFTQISGLKKGSDVRVGGIRIGAVTGNDLDAESYKAKIDMVIDKDVKLPIDSVATVAQEGLLGGYHVAITPGVETEMLQDGEFFDKTTPAVDLTGLLGKMIFSNDDKKEPEEIEGEEETALEAQKEEAEAEAKAQAEAVEAAKIDPEEVKALGEKLENLAEKVSENKKKNGEEEKQDDDDGVEENRDDE